MNTSDFLLERPVDWGFDRIYGYPGDGINGIIQVRREEMAAFLARRAGK